MGSFMEGAVCVANKHTFSCWTFLAKTPVSHSGDFKVFNTFLIQMYSSLYREKSNTTDLYWSILMVFSNSPYTTIFTVSVYSFLKCTSRETVPVFLIFTYHPPSSKSDDKSKQIKVYPFLHPSLSMWFPSSGYIDLMPEKSHVAVHVVSHMVHIKMLKLEQVYLVCSIDGTVFDKTYDNAFWNLT